jgi:K+-transporting ATPase A subunit
MTINGLVQILFFFALILAMTKPLGLFMMHVFNREKTLVNSTCKCNFEISG